MLGGLAFFGMQQASLLFIAVGQGNFKAFPGLKVFAVEWHAACKLDLWWFVSFGRRPKGMRNDSPDGTSSIFTLGPQESLFSKNEEISWRTSSEFPRDETKNSYEIGNCVIVRMNLHPATSDWIFIWGLIRKKRACWPIHLLLAWTFLQCQKSWVSWETFQSRPRTKPSRTSSKGLYGSSSKKRIKTR